MIYRIGAHTLQPCRIELPPSKSIANRITLLRALAGMPQTTDNAACNDIAAMQHAIGNTDNIIDIGDAGTAMRFLTAYYAALSGREHTLTGSSRMQQRPIGALVEALRAAGASIRYIDEEGFPPLAIQGGLLQGGEITIKGDISSQFITALLLVAPLMRDGLHLTIIGNIVSRPYIEMTIELMRSFGATITCHDNSITVAPGEYKPACIEIESDWSAASYWYETVAVSRTPMRLKTLWRNTLQGDARIASYFGQLGVATSYDNGDVTLSPGPVTAQNFIADLADTPDIAQTLAMTCALKGIPFQLTGLGNLPLKECDRIAVLISEARKIGFAFTSPEAGTIEWSGNRIPSPHTPSCIDPHGDHRMAMTFAPAALVTGEISISNPDVVAKSYPLFWDDLQRAGFVITPYDPNEEVQP